LIWRNPQLAAMLRDQGHLAVAADDVQGVTEALEGLFDRWLENGLEDSGKASPYTSEAATSQLVSWARAAVDTRSREKS